MKPTDTPETGDFGENDATSPPLLKRAVWGVPLTWWAGIVVCLLLAVWWLFLHSPQAGNAPTFPAPDTGEQTWQETPPPVMLTPESRTPPSGSADRNGTLDQLARDVKQAMDERDAGLTRTQETLRESITSLANAVRKDEEYAQDTRRQLEALRREVDALRLQKNVTPAAQPVTPSATAKKPVPASALSGMKIMSLENGMAWVRWQGSTWAVREGDTLGRVLIRRIDPDSRTIITSAGTLR